MIVSQDPAVHLNCRTHQILALLASRTTAVDLLYCTALQDTRDIFDHCYRRGLYRWSFDYPYDWADHLAGLGVRLVTHGTLDISQFTDLAVTAVDRGTAVSFFAPRSQIPYQAEYLNDMGVPVEEFLPHSFLLCGIDTPPTTLLIRDDATANHEFADFYLPWDLAVSGWRTTPSEWFTNVTSIELDEMATDLDYFEQTYVHVIKDNRDEHELYGMLGERLTTEPEQYPDVFTAPGLNSLSMLAGSRILFSRFLKRTNHSAELNALARSNVKAICAVLDAATANHLAPNTAVRSQIGRSLARLQQREGELLTLLKQECARIRAVGDTVLKQHIVTT
jgi:hypothetical protein